jgi:hypothetical protein
LSGWSGGSSSGARPDRVASRIHEDGIMDSPWLGLIELFVVLLFALGWGILELFTLRLDKRRRAQVERTEKSDEPPHD